MRIGIYGGSFNPIHNGHISILKEAKEKLSLDKVIIIPTAIPPHKESSEMVSAEDRINMIKLATADIDYIEVSDIEISRGGKSYTIDTLLDICTRNHDYFLIMGTDMYKTFKLWFRYEEIIELVTIVCAARKQGDYEELLKLKEEYEFDSIVLSIPIVDVSSTEIRAGTHLELESRLVEEYIEQNSLYSFKNTTYAYPLEEYRAILKSNLKKSRYIHSLNVAEEAKRLASIYKADEYLCYTAGLLHDFTKCFDDEWHISILKNTAYWQDSIFRKQKAVWHGFSASEYLKSELNILNCEILNAIKYHSTGRRNMSLIEKIVFVADLTSIDRDYHDVAIVRELAGKDIDLAVRYILKFTIQKLLNNDTSLLSFTIDAYNNLSI